MNDHIDRKEKVCETCSNCIPIGNGDHICDLAPDFSDESIIIEEYEPTDSYFWCQGNEYQE